MAAITVTEILERARAAADMDDNFVTSTVWLRWLNVEMRALTMFMARNGYVVRENTATIAADGSLLYDITEPMAILGVYELLDGRYRRLRHSDAQDGAGWGDTTVTGPASTFRVAQNVDSAGVGKLAVFLQPVPQSGTYKVSILAMPVLLALTDSFQMPAGCEERLVLGIARRALAKEESSTSEISQQIAETDRFIEEFCFERVTAGHHQIRNVDRVERGWTDFPGIPSREYWYWM